MAAALSEAQETRYRQALAEDPGNPQFAEYARALVACGRAKEAIHVCLAGVSSNTTFSEGRLALALSFFEAGYRPFCVRELELLSKHHPQVSEIRKLLMLLGGTDSADSDSSGDGEETVLADTEFDVDILEELAESDPDPKKR